MKVFNHIIILLLAASMAVACTKVLAQGNNLVLNDIVECILGQDADKLSQYFDERVEITVDGKSREYARNQAKFVVKNFLDDYPPDAFGFNHQGSTNNTLYALGTYRSEEGVFDVDLYLKVYQETYYIDQIKFEKKQE